MSYRSLAFAVVLFACGPSVSNNPDGGNPGPDGPSGSCSGSETRCAGNTFQQCQGDTWTDVSVCNQPMVCSQDLGCVACNPDFGRNCVGDEVHECNADGTVGPLVQTCDFESCTNGMCQDACGAAEANRSYIGCEYWPVDLDNAIEVLGPPFIPGDCSAVGGMGTLTTLPLCPATGFGQPSLCDYGGVCPGGGACTPTSTCALDAQHSPFAIVVSNPDPSDSVMVTLTNSTGISQSVMVAPGAVQSLFPQMMGFPDQSLDYSGITPMAYKLTSTKPIVAYQFNPLDNVGVFSNDASLLLPRHTYDISYYTISYKTLTRQPNAHDYNGYVAIVASGTGTTMVTVTPTAGVRAGANVPAMSAGSTMTFTLTQFDVLNLEAVADGELSGTTITASQPVGVFSGHEATVISNMAMSPCCADHLEDQLFPASTWGKVYAIPRTQPRAGNPDMLRIMAQHPNTTITFNPPQSGCTATLGPGQFCDVFVSGDVEVSSAEPILIGHYLLSTGGIDPDSGDPAISFAVPTEQYRLDYTFLVPSQYNSNYVSLVAPAAGTILLDGTDVTGMLATFGSGAYKAARIPVAAGQHKLDCPMGCGVEVYGYSEAVSYHFAGGLDLKQIVVE